jgi:hypothetical protein
MAAGLNFVIAVLFLGVLVSGQYRSLQGSVFYLPNGSITVCPFLIIYLSKRNLARFLVDLFVNETSERKSDFCSSDVASVCSRSSGSVCGSIWLV